MNMQAINLDEVEPVLGSGPRVDGFMAAIARARKTTPNLAPAPEGFYSHTRELELERLRAPVAQSVPLFKSARR